MTPPVIHPGPSLTGTVALLERAGLPTSDLTEAHLAHFFYSGRPTAPDGLIGLELYGSHALLRSLVVAPERRSSGLGSALVDYTEAYAFRAGVQFIFLLTTTAESFFRGRGYALADRLSAPAQIRGTREFADICPESSVFMVKHIAGSSRGG
jgi:amino-acid N-acetyltransferase